MLCLLRRRRRQVFMQQDVERLIEAAKNLSAEDQQRLLAALTQAAPAPLRRITELRGLGKEIWAGHDAQEYVDAERESWAD
jgi:tripartite-type tricarboxylate transporter receptor subunit TctC